QQHQVRHVIDHEVQVIETGTRVDDDVVVHGHHDVENRAYEVWGNNLGVLRRDWGEQHVHPTRMFDEHRFELLGIDLQPKWHSIQDRLCVAGVHQHANVTERQVGVHQSNPLAADFL